MDAQLSEVGAVLDRILDGEHTVQERMMLRACVCGPDGGKARLLGYALNEAVILKEISCASWMPMFL